MAGKVEEGTEAGPGDEDTGTESPQLADYLHFAVGPLGLKLDEFLKMTWGEFFARGKYFLSHSQAELHKWQNMIVTIQNSGYHIKNFVTAGDLFADRKEKIRAMFKENRERYVELSRKYPDIKFLGTKN